MDPEQIIGSLRSNYQQRNFLGFDQIAEDIRTISRLSTERLSATFIPIENVLLVSFDLNVFFVKTKTAYSTPLSIKYFSNHPAVAPVFFLQSLPTTHFKKGHSCVRSHDGVIIKIPSLANWRPTTQIQDVIKQIREEFEKDFPIRQTVDTSVWQPVDTPIPQNTLPIQVTPAPPPTQVNKVPYKPTPQRSPPFVSPDVLAAEEQNMRAELRSRIDDARAIMAQRANIERDTLQQLRGELYQRIGYANNARDEKAKEFASMEKVVYDLSERCRDVEKFLADHPHEIIPPEKAGVVAMPKDDILVKMINLKARIDGFEGTVTKVEDLRGKSENKQIIDAFYLNARQNFTDICTLQTMLNQNPDYQKYFIDYQK